MNIEIDPADDVKKKFWFITSIIFGGAIICAIIQALISFKTSFASYGGLCVPTAYIAVDVGRTWLGIEKATLALIFGMILSGLLCLGVVLSGMTNWTLTVFVLTCGPLTYVTVLAMVRWWSTPPAEPELS